MVACLGMGCIKIMNHHMLLLLKTLMLDKMLRSINFCFTFGKKRLYFPSVVNTASPIQTNLRERKEFLTNMIFVQENKPHRVVLRALKSHTVQIL